MDSKWCVTQTIPLKDLLHSTLIAKQHSIQNSCTASKGTAVKTKNVSSSGLEMNDVCHTPENIAEIGSDGHCWCRWCMIELLLENSPSPVQRQIYI
ncbi:hypothetical protein CEXT_223201 [Caerostris extrusa]|uniref:Uncharacterized protein n=1 Tax=Caerostris extrusa TaxID=172846 RepID=A0AAV4TK20_CAEEX|nr:hypothetical protein CEXT_223201 [Caerostris extrusa]